MLNTIFGIVGWIGTLLVFAGVAIRLFRPAMGSICVLGGRSPAWSASCFYTLSQWREIGRSFQKRETKLGAMMSISVVAVLAILSASTTAVTPARQAMGPDGGRLLHAVGSDRQGAEQPEDARQGARVRRARRLPALPRRARACTRACQPEHPGRIRRHGSRAGARARIRHRRTPAPSSWNTTAGAKR